MGRRSLLLLLGGLVGPAASSWLVRRRLVLLCLILQGLKRADAMKQQGGMDPFGSVFEAFGFGGREGGRVVARSDSR